MTTTNPLNMPGARVRLRDGLYRDMSSRTGRVVSFNDRNGAPYPLTVCFDGDQNRCCWTSDFVLDVPPTERFIYEGREFERVLRFPSDAAANAFMLSLEGTRWGTLHVTKTGDVILAPMTDCGRPISHPSDAEAVR